MDISMTVLGSLFIIQIKPLYSASLSLHSKKKMQSATAFFNACDTGKGWAECAQYCTPNATFDSWTSSPSLASRHRLSSGPWRRTLSGCKLSLDLELEVQLDFT